MNKLFKQNNNYSDLNCDKAIKDLSEAIKFKTVSNLDQAKMDFNEFHLFHKYIMDNFPNINKYGTSKIINQGSIYYTIVGNNPKLPALVLMGHLDVVPPIMLDKWEYEPFSGKIINNYIYGRGALDMKHIDMAVLNAVEYSLSHYGKPNRTIYICFGHDEETLGMKGQWEIKNVLKQENANIGMVLDEGGSISDGTEYGAKANLLEIQVSEKGYLDVIVEGFNKGGHSSNPGSTTALADVSKAITNICANPFEADLNKPLIFFFKSIYNYITDEKLKQLVANIDNDSKAVANYLSDNLNLSSLVRTTIAPTMIESDSKGANVLPQHVKALINLRLASQDTIESAMKHINEVCKDCNVTISSMNAINASKISNVESSEYNLLTSLINESFNIDAIVPTISVGGTDCCFYNEICDNCYRFTPIIPDQELLNGVHGYNEHINIDSYLNGIKFYIDLIKKYNY